MLAEARGPETLGSAAPWEPSNAGEDIMDQRMRHNQWSENNQRKPSSHKSCFLGLETKPELIWEDWDLQSELTKTLVLKNKHSKLQKLHVRPPMSKFFTTSISQIIFISPGTSVSVPITFTPLQRCEYEDSIEFQGKEGSFQVCLRATLPCPALEVPDSVLLPLCAVQHSSHTTFLLRNVSKLQTCFQWECSSPFHLSPERGSLEPGQECQITVAFQPQEALVHQQHVYCRFGEEENQADSFCIVLLQGLAKYPCLQLRAPGGKDKKQLLNTELQFGSVAVGHSLQKRFDIFNPSPVHSSFLISLMSDDVPLLGSEFSCDKSRGEVAPGGSLQVTVTYTPAVVDTSSVEYLSIKCKGALKETLLKLTGNCIGPNVSLSSSVVDFGCIEEGGSVVQIVELFNSSSVEAIYQWDLDCNGHSVFNIQPASGTIHPLSIITLKAVYRPTLPIAHHRKVACLILHREPLFLDLIGTCHSELQKPVVLKPEHLILYKLHWSRKQTPPDPHDTKQHVQSIHPDQQEVFSPLQEQIHQGRNNDGDVSKMEEYFQSSLGYVDRPSFGSSSFSPHISVKPSELLFNHKTSSSLTSSCASSQSVSITNHTRGKLSLTWTEAQDSPFSVSPLSCDLAPLKSTSFRVNYDPKQLNTLHEAQLECFAYFKENHHLDGQLLCPPWSVVVRVIGHSFQPGKEHFVPSCSLRPPRVVFPALSVLSYRTVLLHNTGELPLTFCLNHPSNSTLEDSVSVVPKCGLIQPWNHQILTLRATSAEDSPRQGFSLHLQLNASKHSKELVVVCVAEKLRVFLEGDGSLHFKATPVGSLTLRSHHIRNLSRLPLCFKWTIPEPDQQLICVEPDAGELQPNESSIQAWSFNPLEEKAYTFKPTLTFWPIQTPGSNVSHLTLTVMGTGSKGFLKTKTEVLDVGEILVGSYRSIEVPLVNSSPCTVSFILSVQQTLLDEEAIHDLQTVPKDVKLDHERGTVSSQSTLNLQLTVRPHKQTQYQWIISYQTLSASGTVLSPPQAVCRVLAKGVFPTLKVIDVCSGGRAERLSKVHLWKLFSLDSFNEHLLSDPSPLELTYKTSTRHSTRSSPSVFTQTFLDFDFSAAPLHSDPSTFMLMFHNPGSLPVDWVFLFPEDQQIELEYWAETGEFSSTELYQMKVQENRLFSISPCSGTLLPGQQRAVSFSYSHDFTGTDRFPVVFKISHGREILLNFQGVTTKVDRPCLYFASKRHVFTSVSIGDTHPPKQVYELHNGGAVPVHYEVDRTMLLQLQVENFNHPLLDCLRPEGIVLPGETAMLEWIFSPLEAKVYYMDILIHVQDGDSTLVRFEGCGLITPTLRSTNQFKSTDWRNSELCVQRQPFPNQAVFLSEDSISLGNILVGSLSSRILYLTNVTHTDTVRYTWDQQSIQLEVKINPQQGVLHPGDTAVCFLTFTATDYPTDYQLDVICQIIQETALTQYQDALQRWEEEKERQQVEFTITDKNVLENQIVLIDKLQEPVGASARKGPALRTYKTLPAICARARSKTEAIVCTKLTRAERRAQREAAKVWRRPETPKPSLLHLGITAHSHVPLDYVTHFPDQFNRQNRYRQMMLPHTLKPTTISTHSLSGLPSVTCGPDGDITMEVLTSVLRDILEDSAFTESLSALASNPQTYQISETTPTQSPVLPSSLPPRPFPTALSQAASQPPVLFSGIINAETKQHNRVESQDTTGSPIKGPQRENTQHTRHVPADISEDVLLNTIQNLMIEAVRGELVLTAHPRSVNLPPVSNR
ncbi:cilia- and flagella-associated protein 65 isoform X1 [Halichoeres trimaculatus]|uniref:cilia- and flagella-associated protein 65 isoform X1 n=1 Tax=Halichoeres trimaculatus TaxID=147232 RepID=UPI003D9E91FA